MTCKSYRIVIALVLALFIIAPALAATSDQAGSPVPITLNYTKITADNPGVYVNGSTLTITLPGEYLIKGTLTNGQIIVDCEQTGKVRLYFSGVSVHCSNGPALYIKACSPRLTIELVEGTVNTLSDGTVYADKTGKIDGVIYSKSDLTITGAGTLNVKGNFWDGIVSKDDLRFKGGKINVEAVHNGIMGKDCVEIFDGEIIVKAGKDGIKTSNEEAGLGYISMEGGVVSITCGDDPLVVVNALNITGGTINAVINPSLNTTD